MCLTIEMMSRLLTFLVMRCSKTVSQDVYNNGIVNTLHTNVYFYISRNDSDQWVAILGY